MEPSYTLTYSELIRVFERWDKEHLEEYPESKITNPEIDSVRQADEFVRILHEVKA
jgi:hypothetical protein